ncbi:M24 family metallopeptidase [Maioricimonas sp. JC845]|uniref:M24 family metallopeptidase n=1 Tax=Maioricimonas sp. JC845 TaxID=3232138 RepID=UPI00345AC607
MAFDVSSIQQALREFDIDAWLLYDFRGCNSLARRVLEIDDDAIGSRRWLYRIPAEGEPHKLVHRIEASALDHLPGEKTVYLRWQEFEAGVAELVNGFARVAMEYSPRNSNPYVARVDAGTVELVRGEGADVVSSGDLVQLFESVWDDEQWAMHQAAAVHTNAAFDVAWNFIAEQVRSNGGVEEAAVRDAIMDHFAANDLVTYHPPIVGRGPHSGLPHYETGTGDDTLIREGDFVLIDLWAKLNRPRAVYSDLTRTGYVGTDVPQKYTEIFEIVAASRDAGIALVRDAFAQSRPLQGWEVDDAVRNVIEEAGYGEYFRHRTGHNIGQEVHGNGAHMDNLETHEERLVLPRTCFSIEPGIYLPEFGVRSEVDVYIDESGGVQVTGGELQTEVVPILSR